MLSFDEVLGIVQSKGLRLNQHVPEFRAFLDYVKGYFISNHIYDPVVVEVGILDGAQKIFYKEMFNATYIGIDINPKANPDILVDSGTSMAVRLLQQKLNGKRVDLTFIDGLHTYDGVKADYEMYYPLTKHIVAIHDIFNSPLSDGDKTGVRKFWRDIRENDKLNIILEVECYNPRDPHEFNGRPLGIGIICKNGRNYL